MTVKLPPPDLQIAFAEKLRLLRQSHLRDALADVVRTLDIPALDKELGRFAPGHALGVLASAGLRGELVFASPIVMACNPMLLGYYRLLLGFSQKEFYTSTTGLGTFKAMEEHGRLSPRNAQQLPELATALCNAGATLVAGIGHANLNADVLDDLTLLTLGPQFRGSANVARGAAGIRIVFNAIHDIVRHAVTAATSKQLALRNAAGRTVRIEFAADPDIIITEDMPNDRRKIVAIEVKAGTDFSNYHNRLGEAEKSHQKAKAGGYTECWTVVNVDKIDLVKAHRESPTTNRFVNMADLVKAEGREYLDFRDRVLSLTGIASSS